MNIFKFFQSREKKEKLSHLKALVALAYADGVVQKSELKAIASVCEREGLTPEEFENCIKNPKDIDFVPPQDDETRFRYIKDMVILMMIDGDIDQNELLLCKITAEELGFRHEIIDALIMNIISDIKKEMDF